MMRITLVTEFGGEALSLATTLIVFVPARRLTTRLQFATLLLLAVPPAAEAPLTVTDLIPLLPRPASDAAPAKVMALTATISRSLWLVKASRAGQLSPLATS